LVVSVAAILKVAHPPLALAFTGTWVVYTIDRLRDIERDRNAWPLRSRFVALHRTKLIGLTAVAASAALVLGLRQGLATTVLCGAVLGLGLLHRRLKGHPGVESAYVTIAWLAVAVGLPSLAAPLSAEARSLLPWIAVVLAGSLGANALASSLCDAQETAPPLPPWLGAAGLAVVVSAAVAWTGPPALRPLLAVALAQAGALLFFRRNERYALGVLDGSLLLGAAVAYVSAR